MSKISSIVFLVVAFEFCSPPNTPTAISIKDSLLNNYLQITDSIRWIQNVDDMRALLKAYNKNDTNRIREMIQTIKDYMAVQNNPTDNPICPQPLDVRTYNFENIYQFEYSLSFCNEKINITVAFKSDTVFLSGYVYKKSLYSDSCLSYEKVDKFLNPTESKKIGAMLYKSDIWGLKVSNDEYGFDGSSLRLTACLKIENQRILRYTRIYRWSAEQTHLAEAFGEILKTSGLKTSCIN